MQVRIPSRAMICAALESVVPDARLSVSTYHFLLRGIQSDHPLKVYADLNAFWSSDPGDERPPSLGGVDEEWIGLWKATTPGSLEEVRQSAKADFDILAIRLGAR